MARNCGRCSGRSAATRSGPSRRRSIGWVRLLLREGRACRRRQQAGPSQRLEDGTATVIHARAKTSRPRPASPSGTARSSTCATTRSWPGSHCCLSGMPTRQRGSVPTYGKLQAAGPEQAVPPWSPQAPPPHRTHAACGPQNGRQSASRWHGKHLVSNEQNPALPVVVSQRPVPPPGRAHATDGPPLPPHSVSGCPALQPPVS